MQRYWRKRRITLHPALMRYNKDMVEQEVDTPMRFFSPR